MNRHLAVTLDFNLSLRCRVVIVTRLRGVLLRRCSKTQVYFSKVDPSKLKGTSGQLTYSAAVWSALKHWDHLDIMHNAK